MIFEVANCSVHEIRVIGDRQSGKTQTIVDLVAGGIVCGGCPKIMARTDSEGRHVEARLGMRLAELGVPTPWAVAKRSVRCRSSLGARGLTGPLYFEEDD